MPTQKQLDQVTKIAVETIAEQLNKTQLEVIQNHQSEIFNLVCAFAAQANEGK